MPVSSKTQAKCLHKWRFMTNFAPQFHEEGALKLPLFCYNSDNI